MIPYHLSIHHSFQILFYNINPPLLKTTPWFFPSSFQSITDLIAVSALSHITCPNHCIFWLFTNPFMVVIFNSFCSSQLNLQFCPVLVSINRPHILLKFLIMFIVSNQTKFKHLPIIILTHTTVSLDELNIYVFEYCF